MKRSLWLAIPSVALASVVGAWLLRDSSPRDEALAARELATRKLAEYLAQKFPGQRALIVANPFTQKDGTAREIVAMEQAGIAGLKEGFGKKITVAGVVFPELKPEAEANPRAVYIDSETTTPLSYLVAEDAFDKLASRHPDTDLMVSLIGLPAALDRVRCWREEKPRFALLLPDLRLIGSAAAVRQAVMSGKLVAFVLNKPGGSGLRFEDRFLLVTAENIDEILAQYKQLFPAR